MQKFRYLADPVFVFSASAYALNRFIAAPVWGSEVPFLPNHFGDVLLIPCALPILLWLQRITRLRNHDRFPTVAEIVGTLVLWSVLFEWFFPCFVHRGVSDPLDVLAYSLGALLSGIAWHWPRHAPGGMHDGNSRWKQTVLRK